MSVLSSVLHDFFFTNRYKLAKIDFNRENSFKYSHLSPPQCMGKCDGVDETDLFRHSVTEPEGPPEPFSLYSTLPRSMRETKLVTNVKVEEDEEVLRARQELVQTRTPAQLSAITSISDLPVPSKLTKMMGSRESSAHGPRPASTAPSVGGGEKQTSRTPR